MIYLDHNATTPMRAEVLEVMLEFFKEPSNASSVHSFGRRAKFAMEQSRSRLGELIGIEKRDSNYQIVFTSSGTEANNLVMSNFASEDVFISAIEHASIWQLKDYMPNVKLIKVNNCGLVDLEDLEQKLAASTTQQKLVSVMLANNETGVIQNIKEIALIARRYAAKIHSDMVQALGKIEINLDDFGIDFITVSSHKIGGPSGAGALIFRKDEHLRPMLIGGGQERGTRAGTENIAAIVGFGEAAKIAKAQLLNVASNMRYLQTYLEANLHGLRVASQLAPRLPNTTLVLLGAYSAEEVIIKLDMMGIAVSSGSACSSGKVSHSHVLKAMGEASRSALRISTGYNQSTDDINCVIREISAIIKHNDRKIA